MAKLFSLASWNVEHFKGEPQRVGRVVAFLKEQNPDVLGLYEVEGKVVFSQMVDNFPGYQFHITEGPQTQEILVGVRNGLTAFFTQRVEFKSGNPSLRPGALLTLHFGNDNYSLLFLHTKSSGTPVGLGLRDDMFNRAFKLKKTLDKVAGGKGKANFMFMGDLNTMGMTYPFDKSIDADIELRKLENEASKVKMRRLGKSSKTWWNGPKSSYPKSDLDQVVASEHMRFRQFAGGVDVDVRGWPKLSTPAEQGDWIKKHSDHGLLYLVVEKP